GARPGPRLAGVVEAPRKQAGPARSAAGLLPWSRRGCGVGGTMRAKFRCAEKTQRADPQAPGGFSYAVRFDAVNRNPNVQDEDEVFGRYTPTGQLTMVIRNVNAAEQVVPGVSYYLDF